jgi:hypothetical protein
LRQGRALARLRLVRPDQGRAQRPPKLCRKGKVATAAHVYIGLHVDIPEADDLDPLPAADGFVPRQKYQFAMFGEKSSLEEVLRPIAEKMEADLYLGSGEISDTLIHQIAQDAAKDGRPLVIITFTDCDPSGHQMVISIGRKMQALQDLLFPDLRWELVQAGLTPDQVKAEGLPSSPLKGEEKRAEAWKAAFGIEQTEIDSLTIASRVSILRRFAKKAFEPYIDHDLKKRVTLAEVEWNRAAHKAVDEQVDAEHLSAIRAEAAEKLETMREQIDRINADLKLAGSHFNLPPIEVPGPDTPDPEDLDPGRLAFLRFDSDWIITTKVLIEHRAYGNGAKPPAKKKSRTS